MRRHGNRRRRDGGDQFAEISKKRIGEMAPAEELETDGQDAVERVSGPTDGVVQKTVADQGGEEPLPPVA